MKKIFYVVLSLILFFGLFGVLLLDNLHQNRNVFANCYDCIINYASASQENSRITKDIVRPELDEIYDGAKTTQNYIGNSFNITPNNLQKMYNQQFLNLANTDENALITKNPETNISASSKTKPKMAIVIDDFGYDRKGVEKMLNLDCTLTIAVMPALEFSEADAKTAHEKGHEVILHMPMEAYGNLPLSWYGPLFIANNDTPEVAYNKINQGINGIPYCNGVNIHMGTAVSQNKTLMREVLKATKERNLIFLDSRTIENSVCEEVGKEVETPVVLRDVFLEHGGANYGVTTDRITEAINLCLKNGKCIVIGHIGSVGRDITAECLKANLNRIKSAGIEIVPLSAFK